MAQNENYNQVDLRVGTEEQFNAKVGTLPAGTLFGITDSTVSKADLSTDLKNEINGKISKPDNPTSDSAVVINSSGTVSTKPLSSITGKSEVAVSAIQPTDGSSEILWINPDGTSGGGSSGGGKLYLHSINFPSIKNTPLLTFYHTSPTQVTDEWIYENLANGANYLIFYPTITAIYQYGTIGLSSKLKQTSSSPSWGAMIDLESSAPTTLSVSQSLQYTVIEV